MDKKLKKARNYDQFVQEYFLPIYPVVADKALERSGVLSGVLLDIGCGGGYLGMELMKRADFEGVFLDIDEAIENSVFNKATLRKKVRDYLKSIGIAVLD